MNHIKHVSVFFLLLRCLPSYMGPAMRRITLQQCLKVFVSKLMVKLFLLTQFVYTISFQRVRQEDFVYVDRECEHMIERAPMYSS